MKKNSNEILNRLKRNLIESETQKISEGLDSSNSVVIAATLDVLRKMKDPLHMHRATELLSHESDFVVIAALKYLNAMSHPISAAEMSLLLKRAVKVKKEAAKLLPNMEFNQSCKYAELFLIDVSHDVRISALRSLSKIGCSDLNGKIENLLNDPDPRLKFEAIKTLVEVGEKFEHDLIIDMIFNPSLPDQIRLRALNFYALNSMNPLKIMKKIANSSYLSLSSAAIKFMGIMNCDDVWEFFESLLSNQKAFPIKIYSALDGVTKSCRDRPDLEKLALNYLNHPSLKVKIAAFKAIMTSDGAYALDTVKDFLNSENRDLKALAIPYVYKYPSVENVEALKRVVSEGDEKTLVPALKTLRRLGLNEGVVFDYLDKRFPSKVRTEALKALIAAKEISGEELAIIVESQDLLKFRITALDGLLKIAPEKLLELEVRI